MTPQFLRDLAIQTLRAPEDVARVLIGLRVPTRVLWLALTLMAVLNAFLYGAALVLRPPEESSPFLLPSPLGYMAMYGLALFGMVWALYLVGRWMGGRGSMRHVLVLMVWLQALRLIAQVATVILMAFGTILSLLLSSVVFIVGLWIGVHFVNVGHQLGSPGKALGVLIAAGLVTLMVLSVALSLLALPFLGDLSNV